VKTFLAILGAVVLLGCGGRGPSVVSIPDVAVTNSFALAAHHTSVSGLTLGIQGHLDGTGYVYAANWPTQVLSGAVHWKVYHDWFETNCVIHYHPVGVRSGSLTIQYEFH
jgi:hypothetical protein